ncbi:alpha/beta hydrolase [Saccharothrix violaceirubra]|uniref:alpha/beta hydrolase n=1 Tax=Saccharothrix violaceirubra TaxID=413306 RepID=UPI0031F09558
MPRSTVTALRTFDGLRLVGTLVEPDTPSTRTAVLVHGGGVTREEGGFFGRLATGLAEAGITSLRFDLRGHGESEGRQEECSLTMHLNDISVAVDLGRRETGTVHLIGTSFGGCLVAYYAARRHADVGRLVLLNPQFDYLDRYAGQKSPGTASSPTPRQSATDGHSSTTSSGSARTRSSARSSRRPSSYTAPRTRSSRWSRRGRPSRG